MDYKTQISEFIKDNFQPSEANLANLKMSTDQLLKFLFTVFPDDCISDYDLVDMLKYQGFELKPFVRESYTEEENKKETITSIQKRLALGWCLKSDINLETETFVVPKNVK